MTRTMIQVQPSSFTDNLWASDEGELVEGTKLPYPFPAWADNGHIDNQAFWNGTPFRIIGFSRTPEPGHLDLGWSDPAFQADPQLAVGMYVVTQDKGGGMAVHTTAIQEVKVFQIEEDDSDS